MCNAETRLAWDCHGEYFEYYALECPEDWMALAQEYFTQEHGADECALIDWDWIKGKLRVTVDWHLENDTLDIPSADPYRAAFYREDERNV